MIKQIAAIVLLGTSGLACAGRPDSDRYELKRIPMGPRTDQYVLVPVREQQQADRPYALTGESPRAAGAERANARPTPSHPKGTHGQF